MATTMTWNEKPLKTMGDVIDAACTVTTPDDAGDFLRVFGRNY